jgi:hypothetical protein
MWVVYGYRKRGVGDDAVMVLRLPELVVYHNLRYIVNGSAHIGARGVPRKNRKNRKNPRRVWGR